MTKKYNGKWTEEEIKQAEEYSKQEFTETCYYFGQEHGVDLTRIDFDKELAYFVDKEGIKYRAAFDVIRNYYDEQDLLEELMEEDNND